MKFFWIILFIPICLMNTACAQKAVKESSGKEKKDGDDPAVVLPVLVRGPYLQRATPTSMMIRWRTDALSRSRVYFGSDLSSLKNEVTDSSLVTEHKILLTGIES